VHGGTWIGISKTGRFAAITNYRPTKTCPYVKGKEQREKERDGNKKEERGREEGLK
jgi:uncharacterized protein with NRDE domain